MPSDHTLDLFPTRPTRQTERHAPLAERMRPHTFDEMIGQVGLIGEGSALRAMVASGEIPSVVLWGPPGSGKTTLAWLLASAPETRMQALSAVVSGVKEIREAVEGARRTALRTLLFIDEIHRLNRAQQDVLLPHVEAGTVTLIGATTENPSFTVNAPLLSRCRVLTLAPLAAEEIEALLERAAADKERGLGASGLAPSSESLRAMAEFAQGDARKALGLLEAATALHRQEAQTDSVLNAETVRRAAGQKLLIYDRDREEHYNVVSAFIKSLRASDPDAALYYLARMIGAGEDPLFVARRLMIFASEDIGNADPQALPISVAAHQSVERLGMPEARLPLAQTTTYLACAPKSNASYLALGRAQEAVERSGSAPVPLHLRNAPTPLARELGYGEGYTYPHDEPDAFVPQGNLPKEVPEEPWYQPTERGEEAQIGQRLKAWRTRRRHGPQD